MADDVKAVSLTVDGALSPVSLQNNVAFGEYGDGESAVISVSYGDGPKQISKVTLKGSFPTPPG